jgi:hypothetical protein
MKTGCSMSMIDSTITNRLGRNQNKVFFFSFSYEILRYLFRCVIFLKGWTHYRKVEDTNFIVRAAKLNIKPDQEQCFGKSKRKIN